MRHHFKKSLTKTRNTENVNNSKVGQPETNIPISCLKSERPVTASLHSCRPEVTFDLERGMLSLRRTLVNREAQSTPVNFSRRNFEYFWLLDTATGKFEVDTVAGT